jgi:hypothetical protein
MNGKVTTSFHCFCPCEQKLNFFTVRCTYPYRKPQRGDQILKHLIEGQCFVDYIGSANLFLWCVPILRGY